jgi:hypothetical protein
MNLALHRPAARPAETSGESLPVARSIPFDQSFQVKLTGIRDTQHRETVTVSIESAFTVVSIGYGVVPELVPIEFGVDAGRSAKTLNTISIGDLANEAARAIAKTSGSSNTVPPLEAVLRDGIKLNEQLIQRALFADGNSVLDASTLSRLFQLASAPTPERVHFLYALFDEGSGREFQSEPLLNIAGLGSADGKRPFRYFAKPMVFSPLTTIRLNITEISDVRGDLHVCLHGFKVLGGDGSPTAHGRRIRRRR